MNSKSLEFKLYLGCAEPIIDWLESEGCVSVDEVRTKLESHVGSLISDSLLVTGGARVGSNLSNMSLCIGRIIEHFDKKVCPKCGGTGRKEPCTLGEPDGQECDCS